MILTHLLLSLTSFNDFLIFVVKKKKKPVNLKHSTDISARKQRGILSYFLYGTEANLKRGKSSKPACNHCMF